MEPKTSPSFNEEDTTDLESLGFSNEQIKKLLSLDSKRLEELLPKADKKRRSKPKKEKGDYIISYTTKCRLCGSEQMQHQVADCYKEWKGLHPFYQTGKGICEVECCSECGKYLKTLSVNKLIDIILKRKKDLDTPCPKILYREDKEHTYYPLMVVNINYCSLDERHLAVEVNHIREGLDTKQEELK